MTIVELKQHRMLHAELSEANFNPILFMELINSMFMVSQTYYVHMMLTLIIDVYISTYDNI